MCVSHLKTKLKKMNRWVPGLENNWILVFPSKQAALVTFEQTTKCTLLYWNTSFSILCSFLAGDALDDDSDDGDEDDDDDQPDKFEGSCDDETNESHQSTCTCTCTCKCCFHCQHFSLHVQVHVLFSPVALCWSFDVSDVSATIADTFSKSSKSPRNRNSNVG